MTSIVYQDRVGGLMYIYQPKYPAQRSLFEQKRTERIIAALEELMSFFIRKVSCGKLQNTKYRRFKMQVYIVCGGCVDDHHIIAVYKS